MLEMFFFWQNVSTQTEQRELQQVRTVSVYFVMYNPMEVKRQFLMPHMEEHRVYFKDFLDSTRLHSHPTSPLPPLPSPFPSPPLRLEVGPFKSS